ncbi:MAG TPA: sugar phosphate isomerase/epimerase family protein [Phycisphaerae bacterium]|nr:sugar phosphate isomerase/epimerase family protein [Phycisphaerae bacterium]HNU45014.1 sugar phosphate isomerase/epimerase family protein [Phycisphaerae bacterium]
MQSRIGVCSWSLRPTSPEDLAQKVRAVGLDAIQLALDPLRTGAWPTAQTVATLGAAGIGIRSGMLAMRGEDYTSLESIRRTGGLRPDEYWSDNLAAVEANATIVAQLGLKLVTFHAGFIPHERGDPLRAVLGERVRAVADRLAGVGARVGLETGQETADHLLGFLEELQHPAVGVNFDPANMILYGRGDPVAALRALSAHVVQVHVKDAVPAATPGTWGREVPVGTGAVDWPGFFTVLRQAAFSGDLMIEREAGDTRSGDIDAARRRVATWIGQPEGSEH